MASPYQHTPSGSKQPMDLEHVNRGFSHNQQVAVYALPEERRVQNVMFQGQETEDMHIGRK